MSPPGITKQEQPGSLEQGWCLQRAGNGGIHGNTRVGPLSSTARGPESLGDRQLPASDHRVASAARWDTEQPQRESQA